MRRVRMTLTLLLVGAAGTACTSSHTGASGALTTVRPTVATGTQAGTGQPTATPGGSTAPTASAGANCDDDPWHAAPVQVTHTGSATSTVTAIRPGTHPDCGYDRVTFDVTGAAPSYTVEYVTQVIADGSGEPIALPGQKFLLITMRPAQGHDTGGTTITPQSATLGYPVLKGYAVAGDSEGILTVALGLAGTAQVRTGELAGRVYVDVRA